MTWGEFLLYFIPEVKNEGCIDSDEGPNYQDLEQQKQTSFDLTCMCAPRYREIPTTEPNDWALTLNIPNSYSALISNIDSSFDNVDTTAPLLNQNYLYTLNLDQLHQETRGTSIYDSTQKIQQSSSAKQPQSIS